MVRANISFSKGLRFAALLAPLLGLLPWLESTSTPPPPPSQPEQILTFKPDPPPALLPELKAEQAQWTTLIPGGELQLIPAPSFYSFATLGDQFLFAGALDGYVYRSADGLEFERLGVRASVGMAVKSVYVSHAGTVFASGVDLERGLGLIYRSRDQGNSWEQVYASAEWGASRATLWRWAELADGILLGGLYNDKTRSQARVYASNDEGTNWHVLVDFGLKEPGAHHVHHVLVARDGAIWVSVGDQDRGLWVSRDQGRSWNKVFDKDGFTGILELGDHLVLTPDDCGAAFSLVSEGADTVTPVFKPDFDFNTGCVTLDVVEQGSLLLTATLADDPAQQGHVFLSGDGGASWEPAFARQSGVFNYWDMAVFRGEVYLAYRNARDAQRPGSEPRYLARLHLPSAKAVAWVALQTSNLAPNLSADRGASGQASGWTLEIEGSAKSLQSSAAPSDAPVMRLDSSLGGTITLRTAAPIAVHHNQIWLIVQARAATGSPVHLQVELEMLAAPGKWLRVEQTALDIPGAWQQRALAFLLPPGTRQVVPRLRLDRQAVLDIGQILMLQGPLAPAILAQLN